MSSELYIPNIIGKPGTEFYRHSETWRRRSEASKKKAAKYWSDPKNHERVDTKQAKPVAAYRLDGTFVGWWPSSRKAALALFPSEELRSAERNVRACRQTPKRGESLMTSRTRKRLCSRSWHTKKATKPLWAR